MAYKEALYIKKLFIAVSLVNKINFTNKKPKTAGRWCVGTEATV